MNVLAADFVCYPVTDMARSVAFYRDVLGLTQGMTYESQWAEFDLPPTTFALFCDPSGQYAPPTKRGGLVALAVEDVEAAMEELKAQGVEFTMPLMNTHVCKMAAFADPDGNELFLHARHDGTRG
ncbi:MAG: VOC family protein [Opitutales bacterium]